MSHDGVHTLNRSARFPLRWFAETPGVLIIIVVALAALVRCAGLGRLDLGTDEAHSFLTATSPHGILFELHNDTNLPLYFFLLKGWIAVFGTSLGAMRLMSAILGIAGVAALGGLARQCGGSWRTTVWALLLAAFTPVQLHYAQMARGYTLLWLLLTLGLWSFVYALQSRRAAAWAIHGIVVALGAWTHALMVPIAAGDVLTALLMRVSVRQLLAMGMTYFGAALMALPALLLALHQSRTSGGMAWLRDYWLATPPALAIPQSLAVLALGGNMPRYLLTLPLAWPLELAALGLTAVAAGGFFWPRRGVSGQSTDGPAAEFTEQRWRWLWIVFTLWPLVFVWGYSAAVTPIYLVGRYDLFAQPAYLMLLAMGFSRVQTAFSHWLPRLLLPTLVCGVLAAGVYDHREFPLDRQIFHHQARVNYLAGVMKPGEPIICTGLEGSPTLYWVRQRHLDAAVSTFPRETLAHPGWLINDEDILARRNEWPAEIVQALDAAAPGRQRVWVFLDGAAWNPPGDFAASPRQMLTLRFVPTALANGWRLAESDPSRRAVEADLRIVSLIRVER